MPPLRRVTSCSPSASARTVTAHSLNAIGMRIPSVKQQRLPLGRVRERIRRRIQDTQESRNLQISLQNDPLFSGSAGLNSLRQARSGALLDRFDEGSEVVVGMSESLRLAHVGERALCALEG